jgi:Ca2+-binding RTX toxin-like protein
MFVNVTAAGTVGTEVVAISGSDSATSTTSSARLTNGDVVFVYDFDTTDDAIAYSVRNPVTGASTTGGAFVADTDSNGDTDSAASVVALTGGGFVIAWANTDSNDTDILFQRYDNAGAAQGALVYVASDGATDNNNEVHLVALSDGGFLVLWDNDEAGQLSGQGQRYSATGSEVGSVFTFDSSNANHVDAELLADGRVALTWNDGEIHAAIIDTRDAPNSPGVYAPDQWVVGTAGDDIFTPNANAEITHGWDGNDVITESGGTRDYYGDAGDDRINVVSFVNSDLHDGGSGTDTIDWSAVAQNGITFDLGAGTATVGLDSEVMRHFENLNGTNLNDTIIGSSGSNVLNGNGGDDIIIGGFSTDTIDGGSGNDTFIINTGEYSDNITGGSGTDLLDVSSRSDHALTLDLAAGTYTLMGPANTIATVENVNGTQLNDSITGSSSANVLNGGAGQDQIFGGGGNDIIDGGAQGDVLRGEAGNDILTGGAGTGADNLGGGDGNDTLSGGGGRDTLRGNGDDDVLSGGDGNDRLYGDTGRDTLYGGEGRDQIDGGSAADDMAGGNGSDVYWIDNVGDTITEFGGGGVDLVYSTISLNLAVLSQLVERLRLEGTGNLDATGNARDNELGGTSGNNTLSGSSGNDTIFAGDGNDFLYGGADDDLLVGGNGTDEIWGGAGADTFRFSNGFGVDVIHDFSTGTLGEVIDLSLVNAITSWADLTANHLGSNGSGDATITVGANVLTLDGVSAASLSAGDFVF